MKAKICRCFTPPTTKAKPTSKKKNDVKASFRKVRGSVALARAKESLAWGDAKAAVSQNTGLIIQNVMSIEILKCQRACARGNKGFGFALKCARLDLARLDAGHRNCSGFPGTGLQTVRYVAEPEAFYLAH